MGTTTINQATKNALTTASTKRSLSAERRNLPIVSAEGVNALDLFSERAAGKDFAKAQAYLEMNYGIEFPEEKIRMLFELMAEEGWSQARLEATVKWFLKNKKFATWTVADWFEYGVKLYPYSWYQEQISKGVKAEDLECFQVQDKVLWKMKDGQDLPFPRPQQKVSETVQEEDPEEDNSDSPDMKPQDLVPIFSIKDAAVKPDGKFHNPEVYARARANFEEALKKEQNK